MKEQLKYQTMEDGMTKNFIWPLFNRVVHLLLILFFSITFILGDMDELLDYHAIFGILFMVLFFYRILWGFIGPKYSKFKDLNFNKKDLKEYLSSPFSHVKEYVGHNPASSFAILIMILFSILATLTGMLTYGIQENHGVFAFLHSSFFKEMELFEELHELFANLLIGVIVIHVAGSLIDRFIKKGDGIDSMISGYKKISTNLSIKTNIFQKFFILMCLVSFIYVIYYLFTTKENIFTANLNKKQYYGMQHIEFANECGSCHITYPPFLLPKNSWALMMKDLENHFGDDASIDEELNISILSFLEKNSSENSSHQAAVYILKSLKENNSTIAITKTPYWQKRHEKIDKDIFLSKDVKSKANCSACHQDIEFGLLENSLIKIPKKG